MSTIPTSPTDVPEAKHPLVEVTLEVTDEEGETQTTTKELPRGETPVATLEQELGITDVQQLWLIRKGHKPRPLAKHEKVDVKAGDHYEALVKGAIS